MGEDAWNVIKPLLLVKQESRLAFARAAQLLCTEEAHPPSTPPPSSTAAARFLGRRVVSALMQL